MQTDIEQIIYEVERVIQGKRMQVKLAIAAFLAQGHVLIDDLPGVGKTSLAKVFSKVLGLQYSRIQFTSDMLPSDILGMNFFDTKESSFHFRPGPIFTQFLLADEINRATPKTQSALLEAMEEHQVSIDAKTLALPSPFFVIATKNPFEEVGTFELPSSQLDRFLISFSLGYPDKDAERAILTQSSAPQLENLSSVDPQVLETLKEHVTRVHLSESVLDYLQELLHFTRESGLYAHGLSTRGALALSNMAKAWAVMEGRDYLIPSDIAFVLPYVIGHRLHSKQHKHSAKELADEILSHLHPDT